jgi:nucleoid-associated protein YgaU
MASSGSSPRSGGLIIAATGAVTLLALVAFGVSFWNAISAPPRIPPSGTANAPSAAASVATPEPVLPAPVKPSFDLVRISPGGTAVFAGRAAPNSDVMVQRDTTLLGVAHADTHGAWVLMPDAMLAPGTAELSVTARDPQGRTMAGDATVAVVVPPSAPTGAAPGTALAVLTPDAGPSRLLQAPESVPSAGKFGLDTVDYDGQGAIRFSGGAPPGASVRVYLDNKVAGDAVTDSSGQWILSPTQKVEPGLHRLRLDQIDRLGHVASRVELPFLRETLAATQVAPGQVVVQPGQNLWRLAQRAYGNGVRYTVIYEANKVQIRDARLIYPGQMFAVPPTASPLAESPH